MIARATLGGIFVAILLVGIFYAALSPILQPIALPRIQMPWSAVGTGVIEQYSLVKGTNVSSAVRFVNLNATVKFGGILVLFSNDPNLVLKAVFEHGPSASELDANSAPDGSDSLQANTYGATGSLNLTLGSSCQYGGSLNLRFGAVTMQLDQYSNIGKLAIKINYVGGVLLNVTSGASFEQLDLSMDVGGLQLNVNAENIERSGTITTNVNMGGVIVNAAVNTAHVGMSIEADVDTGGLTVDQTYFEGTVSNTHCSVKTHDYASANTKLDVRASIGAGGGIIQPSTSYVPGFST
jgi:hypothetical protein